MTHQIISDELERLKALKPEELARAYQVLADRVSQAEKERTKHKRKFLTDAEFDDEMTLIYAGNIVADCFVGLQNGFH